MFQLSLIRYCAITRAILYKWGSGHIVAPYKNKKSTVLRPLSKPVDYIRQHKNHATLFRSLSKSIIIINSLIKTLLSYAGQYASLIIMINSIKPILTHPEKKYTYINHMALSICGRTGKDVAFGLLSRKPSPKGLPLFLPDQFLLTSRLMSILLYSS